ncbi:hypothetical protein AVEN_200709-1 [Araneus ventricosus]|uniref:Uncharacterized protein n=1 Tax=Araneus ventricosus TaxID=182803 RepID=A0A4Y2INL9_ARAVE|nr:hypothetical protein AVEN_200709-1 [Araneus ventricosus]
MSTSLPSATSELQDLQPRLCEVQREKASLFDCARCCEFRVIRFEAATDGSASVWFIFWCFSVSRESSAMTLAVSLLTEKCPFSTFFPRLYLFILPLSLNIEYSV